MATRILGGRWTQPGRPRRSRRARPRDGRPAPTRPVSRWPSRPARRRPDRRPPRRGVRGGRLQRATRCAASASATATAYADELARWQDAARRARRARATAARRSGRGSPPTDDDAGRRRADAAEAGAEDDRVRSLRADVDRLGDELGAHQTELAKLEIALRNLESTWLFLERGDASLVDAATPSASPTDVADADRRGPGGRAVAARPGGPRRAGPGPLERDLPGRVHRARHRQRRAARPDGAALPARPAPARARRRPDVHQPAPPAGPRRARPRRRDPRRRRPDDGADGPRDRDRPRRRRRTG